MRNVMLLVLAVLLLPGFTVADYTLSPHGNGIAVAMGASADGQRLIVGYSPVGIWRTNDGGAHWEQINDRVSAARILRPIGNLVNVVDPAADSLFICAYTNYPFQVGKTEFHSHDGGESWSKLDPYSTWPDSIPLIGFGGRVPATSLRQVLGRTYLSQQMAFCVQDHGVWRYTNLEYIHNGVHDMVVNQNEPDTIYLYGSWGQNRFGDNTGGVIVSHDAGYTWERLTPMERYTPINKSFCQFKVLDDSTMIAMTQWDPEQTTYGLFLISRNGGQSWEWIDHDGLPEQGFISWDFEFTPNHPGRLFMASVIKSGVWESDDYGQTWHRLLRGLPTQAASVVDIYRNEYSQDLYICYRELGIYRSTDDGDSWHEVPGPPVGVVTDAYNNGLKSEPGGMLQLTVRLDAFHSLGNGTTFTQLCEHPATDDSYWQQGVMHRNGRLAISRMRRPFNIPPGEDNPVEYHALGFSDDGGQSWSFSPERVFPIGTAPTLVNAIRDDVFIAGSMFANTLFVTHDDGETWDEHELGFTIWNRTVANGVLYGVDAFDGDVVYSWDEGSSWTETGFPNSDAVSATAAQLLVEDGIIRVLAGGFAWHYDPATGWERRGRYTTDSLVEVNTSWTRVTGAADTFLVAGSDEHYALAVSYDDGYSWEEQEFVTLLPDGRELQGTLIKQLIYDRYRDRLWIGTGYGLAYLDDPSTAVGDRVWTMLPADAMTLTSYPNPFNERMTVAYSLPRPGEVRLDVFDILGRQVASLDRGRRNAGDHTLTFDAHDLASGTYLLRLISPEKQLQRRITLVK